LSYNLEASAIRKILFLNNLARLLVLTLDGYLHLLEINNSTSLRLDRICTSSEDDQAILKSTQTLCLLRNNARLLIGVTNGNIYSFNIETFSLNDTPVIPTEIIEKT
jgi:CRISPR/Cas system CMR subunit Cmr6 (Cas7 group RAMP superfamily)